MTGPHFFVAPADVEGDRVVLRDSEAQHLARVLRAAVGDPVSLTDGTGACYSARVAALGGEVALTITDRHVVERPRPSLTVVHALPKARKLDDVVQRLTEVGVDRIVPVHSARSQVRLDGDRALKAVGRWRAVALAAAKQSRRAFLPEIAEVGEWATAFAGATAGAVCWEEAADRPGDSRTLHPPTRVEVSENRSWVTGGLLAQVDRDAAELVLGIGPEGGLTADEVAATGLPVASLGPTVLRTETAALVAASIVLAATGRLG